MYDLPQPHSDEQVISLFKKLMQLHEHASDCETCAKYIDCLAELIAAGQTKAKEPDALWLAIQNHLSCCNDCLEVFEAVVSVTRAHLSGEIDQLDMPNLPPHAPSDKPPLS